MATRPQPSHRTPPHQAQPGQLPERQPAPKERKLREERILDAAATLLVRWGYRKTTIDDVAREAGVGKGTIYLHWKDKNDLFQATIWRASQQVTDDTLQRIAADPDGGLFHRVWTHGLIAVFANPLLAALMKGKPDILQGLMHSMNPATIQRLVGNADEHIVELQHAGLIRSDLPVSVIRYLMGAIKLGIINSPDLMGQENVPSMEQLTEAISDMMLRWLEPEILPGDSTRGKHIMAEWLKQANKIATQQQ